MATLKEIAPCQKELEIQVPTETVEAEYQVVYKEIKKKARVPGFRVGFAPQDLLEQHYGQNAKEEVIRRLVGRGVEEALKSQPNLDLIGRPRVTRVELQPHEPMKFSAQVEVAPAVTLGRYLGLRLKKQKADAPEEGLQRVLAHLQEAHAELKTVLEPRPAQENDFLLTDLTERLPGLPAPRTGTFYVYVIECNDGSHYIGQTDDLQHRWNEHMAGEVDWTKRHNPVKVVHYEEFSTREEAVKRESDLKTGFGRKWLKELIASGRARQAGKEPVKRRDVLLQLDLAKDSQGTMKQLLGMNPGTERSVTLPDGKSVTVQMKEIKAKTLAPIDDAFAKLVGSFENLAALKEAISKDLAKEAEHSQKRALQSQAVELLLDTWNFDVPPSLVVSQARRMVKDRSLELLQQGISPEKVEDQGKLLTEQAKLDALKEVRLFFILRRVAGEEKLTASQSEIDSRVAQMAARLGLQPQALAQDLESRELLDELVWGVIREKVFDLILQEAEIKEG